MRTNGQDQSATAFRDRARWDLDQRIAGVPALSPGFGGSQPGRAMPEQLGFGRPSSDRQERSPLEGLGGLVRGRRHEQQIKPHANLTVDKALPGRKLTDLAEGFKKICQRWGLEGSDMAKLLHLEEEVQLSNWILSGDMAPLTGDLKDRMALVIAISLGLGDLFDDNKEAEIRWLKVNRLELGEANPLEYMLKGDFYRIDEVMQLLDMARGLR